MYSIVFPSLVKTKMQRTTKTTDATKASTPMIPKARVAANQSREKKCKRNN